MNNFQPVCVGLKWGKAQLGFQVALGSISKIPSNVLRKTVNKTPHVHGAPESLHPGWAAFSNCHLLILLIGKEPIINQLVLFHRLIFWRGKQGVILVTPEYSRPIPLRPEKTSPARIKTPPSPLALPGPLSPQHHLGQPPFLISLPSRPSYNCQLGAPVL